MAELATRLIRLGEGDKLLLIALTGYGQPEDIQLAKEAGFDFHMLKPARLDELRRMPAKCKKPSSPAA